MGGGGDLKVRKEKIKETNGGWEEGEGRF